VPTRKINGVELYVETYGSGAVILGIHGTPSSALLWVDAARELASAGRCVIYDRRGFSRSERPAPFEALDLADHVEDAVALLDTVSAPPAVIIGRSTGGQIALAIAHRHPDRVRALVLLEPALFTVDPLARDWAARLRATILRAAADDPSSASEVVFREALGDYAWESLPDDLQDMFRLASPAVLAEIRGQGLDLSERPLDLSSDELARIDQPALIVSAEDSPEVLRRVNDRLAEALPHAATVLVPGGHLIHPAHPVVLEFIGRVLAPPDRQR